MTATSWDLFGAETRPARWRQGLLLIVVAVTLAEIETVQTWFEQRNQPMHDHLAWMAWAMLPPWLLMAALVPAVAALCRRYPLSGGLRALSRHAVFSLLFPVVHLGALALLHRMTGDPTPLLRRMGDLLSFHYLFDVLAYWVIAGTLALRAARHAAAARPVPAPVPAPVAPPAHLVLRDAGGVQVLALESIDWIEARNYCARVHAAGRRHLIRESLNSLEARLDGGRFVRVHRSAIVNLGRVEALRLVGGRPVVVLRGDVVVPASRDRWRALKAQLKPSVDAVQPVS